MPRIFKFTSGPNDWQSLLADPVKQWRKGFSARTLAYCWEAADGFPPEVAVAAVILIHSFCKDLSGWSDYQIFARVFGTEPEIGVVQCLNDSLSVPLFGVWVSGDRSFLES